jgi:hypothetical protein
MIRQTVLGSVFHRVPRHCVIQRRKLLKGFEQMSIAPGVISALVPPGN